MIPTEADRAGNFDDYLVRSKKAATYLRLLNHSRSCKGYCRQSTCRHTYRLLQHTDDCHPNGNYSCEIKGCCTTKKLLAHVSDCTAKALAQGKGRPLCLVCTLASKPMTFDSNSDHSDALGGQTENENSGNNNDVNVKYCGANNVCRPMNRSQSMVDNSEETRLQCVKNSMEAIYRTQLIQTEKVIPFSSSSVHLVSNRNPFIDSKLIDFIVPTMIPKRFRSNTLQHVQHVAVNTNSENKYSNNQQEKNDEQNDFPREKWQCVNTISTKIPVGQL